MKKVLALLLALSLVFAFAACNTETKREVETTDARELFKTIWDAYQADTSISEETKLGFVMGGDVAWNEKIGQMMEEFMTNNPNATEEELIAFNDSLAGPGSLDLTSEDAAGNLSTYSFPAGKEALIDNAASLQHGMMRNNFCAAIYHVADAKNVDELANALKDSIPATQWACGFPDMYTVIVIDDFVIAIFGANQIDPDFGNFTPVADMANVIKNLFETETVIVEAPLF